VLLFLNRRSFAPHVQCETCGHSFSCPRCDVSLAYHAGDGEMKCHLCGLVRPAARSCPSCGGPKLRYGGVGTQRVEREIRRAFPRARLVRMDLDTTRRKGAHDEILDRFRRGEADILLGTQMIAKGLDLPGVSLVGVIHADTALHLPDFRASERTFDLLTQVAGRAGRGEAGGEVVIQTYLPEHKSLACARTHDFLSFYAHAVEARRSAGYPPWTRLIRVLWEGTDLGEVTREAERLAQSLRKGLERAGSRGTEVLGPAPAGFARVKGRHRWHVLVKTREVTLARRVLGAALAERRPSCRRVVDVDPREMM
jgi:primosomal protein N' (replication factor Y)